MKLFITDYDDTLYQDDDKIKENIIMLKRLQENNFKVIISTGRSYPSIKTQINYYQIPYDLICCADGSIIYQKDGSILKMFTMDDKIYEALKNFYQNLSFEEIQFSYPEGYLNYLKDNDTLLGINICISTKNYNSKLVKDFLALKKNFPNYNYLNYQHPNFSYLCVKPLNISKSFAIQYLMKYFSLSKEDIYVIGDSSNDFEMIKDFNGVCMENSCEEVLLIAKKKYATVKEYIKDILEE